MSQTIPLILSIFITITGFSIIGFGVYVYRQYDGRGVRTFVLYTVFLGGSIAVSYLSKAIMFSQDITSNAELQRATIPRSLEISSALSIPINAILLAFPVIWAVFVVLYTANVTKTTMRRLKYLVGGFLVLFLLVEVPTTMVALIGFVMPEVVFQAMKVVQMSVMVILAGSLIVGLGYLYRTYQKTNLLSRGLVGVLLLPVLIPVPFGILQSIAFGWTVPTYLDSVIVPGSLLCLWLSVDHYGLFEQLPAAYAVGRDTAVDSLDTGFLSTDPYNRITDINARGEELFGVSASAVSGTQLDSLLPDGVNATTLLSQGETTFSLPPEGQTIKATATPTTDDRGRELGHTLTFHDITDERRRQQRVQVLNRVLRHNLRNELSVVGGYSEALAAQAENGSDYVDSITDKIDELTQLGEKAREIETVLGVEKTPNTATNLREELTNVTSSVDSSASVQLDVPDDITLFVSPDILNPVITELVENAITHTNSESPTVTITFDPDRNTVTVQDNGPGIPDSEIEVLESGKETPLKHGSGMGLWLVKWGVDRIGGTLSFETNQDGGAVIITFPDSVVLDSSDTTRQSNQESEPESISEQVSL